MIQDIDIDKETFSSYCKNKAIAYPQNQNAIAL